LPPDCRSARSSLSVGFHWRDPVKIGDKELLRNRVIHIALGVMANGTKVVLGLRVEQNEGARF